MSWKVHAAAYVYDGGHALPLLEVRKFHPGLFYLCSIFFNQKTHLSYELYVREKWETEDICTIYEKRVRTSSKEQNFKAKRCLVQEKS